ncbi:hypothetical protein [Streptomyces sp. MA15]|nr:hypothetical protein [Streptomyces sp. MA15]MDN3268119.1 hypothetical protein [Streptomyces sp. MA15]
MAGHGAEGALDRGGADVVAGAELLDESVAKLARVAGFGGR